MVSVTNAKSSPRSSLADGWKLLILWLLGTGVIATWLILDRRPAAWDQGRVLIGSVNFWWTLANDPQWFSTEWWERLWMLSSKFPPLLFIGMGFWQLLWGIGPDRATSINILFQGILLLSTYGLGRYLFGRTAGIWAAILVLLLPKLYVLSAEPLFDYALIAMVAASFCCLTIWRLSATRRQGWLWATIFGIVFGLSILTKQTAVFFLAVPLLWLGIARLWQRRWESLLQLLLGAAIATLAIFPWLRTNWIFLVSSWQNSNLAAAAAEGDPELNTLAAWTYYLERLPQMVSWPLLVVPIVGMLLAWLGQFKRGARDSPSGPAAIFQYRTTAIDAALWLGSFLVGTYIPWSALIKNKDLRFIAPYLPVVAVCLAAGLLVWPRRYAAVRWLTIALAVVLMGCNLFPLGGAAGQWLTQRLAPGSQLRIATQADWPQEEIVRRILAASPYQLSTVGVLPSETWLNQYNVNYAGSLANFQVYGRNLGHRDRVREQDLENTHWFVGLTDPQQETIPWDDLEAWQRSGRLLAEDPNFQLEQTWPLFGDREVSLYRRKQLPITVEPLPTAAATPQPVRLAQVSVPDVVPPGRPVPVTYVWEGAWEQLHAGQVLLTWVPQDAVLAARAENRWLHDHGIGFGTLRPGPIQANQFTQSPAIADDRQWFRVTENAAMQPEATVAPGTYTLQAEYLDPASGRTVPLAVPPIALQVAAAAPPPEAPPLDYVTQVRTLAREMPKGIPALDGVFSSLDRLNLYDPIQNFYVQAETTLAARLQQEPENRDYAYGILLSRVLQRKINASLEILDTIVAIDRQNPYGYAYQAFVNLVAWRPGPAKQALKPALALAPNSAELTGLEAIAHLMQGNLWGAWQRAQAAIALGQD